MSQQDLPCSPSEKKPDPVQHGTAAGYESQGSSSARKTPKRILVVDDEAIVRGVLAKTLQKLGHDVTEAANADEAVKAFLRGRFDLITLDIDMPGMSGLEFQKALSQEFGVGKRVTGALTRKLPPILIITGFADRDDVAKGQFGEGIVGALSKPVEMDVLVRTVQSILEDGGIGEA